MNERTQELAKQAMWSKTDYSQESELYSFSRDELEKFVELIVRECIERIKRVGILEDIENETDMVVDAVKEHFGVTE